MEREAAKSAADASRSGAVRHAGVTLVELLLSLTLSALILITAMEFLGGGMRLKAEVLALSSLHDKAQHAMLLFGNAIRRAGYRGCGGDYAEVVSLLRADLRTIPELNLYQPYTIYESNEDAAGWTPQLAELPMQVGGKSINAIDGRHGIKRNRLQQGSDLLVVRGLGFGLVEIARPVAPEGAVYVTARRGIRRGDYAAITDCRYLELHRVTGYGPSGGGVRLRRAHGLGRADNHPVRLRESLAFSSFEGLGPWLGVVESEFLYVAESHASAELPALWRKQTQRRPLELIEGISDLDLAELLGEEGRPLGVRVSFTARASPSSGQVLLERRFIRHFAFENL